MDHNASSPCRETVNWSKLLFGELLTNPAKQRSFFCSVIVPILNILKTFDLNVDIQLNLFYIVPVHTYYSSAIHVLISLIPITHKLKC